MRTRAGIYTRISEDRDGEGLGVARQEQDCRELVTRRGWEVVAIYADNDLSGSGKVRRSGYQRMLEAIREGELDVVVAYDIDRFQRNHREFLEFYLLCEQRKMLVAWLGGEADFLEERGIFELEIRTGFAGEELRKIRSRVKRKMRELEENGEDHGGVRPFGYQADRKHIEPDEAALIRQAAARVLQGDSLIGICNDWNRRGLKSATGKNWKAPSLRGILCQARISGRRERHLDAEGKRHRVGTITAPAKPAAEKGGWEPIITVDESDALRSLLSNPTRRTNGRTASYLLTGEKGVARCGLCGEPLLAHPRAGTRAMVCKSKAQGGKGCGGVRIVAEPVERIVAEAVLDRIDKEGMKAVLAKFTDPAVLDELAHVEDRKLELAADYASGRIDQGEWQVQREIYAYRHGELSQKVDEARRVYGLQSLPDPLRPAWEDESDERLTLAQRRAVIKFWVEAVVVSRADPHKNTFDPDRIETLWRV